MFPEMLEFHVAKAVNNGIKWLLHSYAPAFDSFSNGILGLLLWIQSVLFGIPWWAYIAFIAVLAWIATKKLIP
ncbi:MAG: choline ABC transporter permease subunit, partial [Synergistota bacterium]|nr:choline ABC transporter permease subunit [Synergistota bacterium]